jgi:hypothetical protein
MSAFVQSYDSKADEYVKLHVASGMEVARSRKSFPDIEEVEPMEDDTPKPMQGYADPLEMMR